MFLPMMVLGCLSLLVIRQTIAAEVKAKFVVASPSGPAAMH
jgi:hypothetical protein